MVQESSLNQISAAHGAITNALSSKARLGFRQKPRNSRKKKLVGRVHANPTPASSDKATLDSVIYVQPLFKDESVLRDLYLEKRLSPAAIAKRLSSSKQSIRKYLRLHQIPLRPEDHVRTFKLRFGVQGNRGRAATDSNNEQNTIKLMHSLKQSGLSYEKIAGVLNKMELKTKTGRGKWYAFSVFKIIRRTATSGSEKE